MCVYMDNLTTHTCNKTAKVLVDQRYRHIFNPPYSPFGNPVEECFAKVKHRYKKMRLNNIVNDIQMDPNEIIEECFKSVDIKLVKGCVRHSKYLIS